MNKTLVGILAIILIGGIGIYLWTGDDVVDINEESISEPGTKTPETTTNTSSQTNNQESTPVVNSVQLAENETGNFVTVAAATLATDGFIALYRTDSTGEVKLIGSSDLLEAGTYTDLEIQTDTVLAYEQSVTAVLFADNDDGELDAGGSDGLLSNENDVLVSDVDVIDVPAEKEAAELLQQAEDLLEAELEAQTESETEV